MSYPPHDPQEPTPPGQSTPPGPDQPPQDGQAPQPGQPPQPGLPPQYGQAPQPGYGGSPAVTVVSEMDPAQQRLWACLAHLSPIVAGLLLTPFTGGFVYLGAVGPLVILLVLKDRGVFVRRQSTEALNFQLLATVVYVAGVLISVVTLGIGLILVVPLLLIFAVVALVFQILAAVRANRGVDQRYPVSLRLVK